MDDITDAELAEALSERRTPIDLTQSPAPLDDITEAQLNEALASIGKPVAHPAWDASNPLAIHEAAVAEERAAIDEQVARKAEARLAQRAKQNATLASLSDLNRRLKESRTTVRESAEMSAVEVYHVLRDLQRRG